MSKIKLTKLNEKQLNKVLGGTAEKAGADGHCRVKCATSDKDQTSLDGRVAELPIDPNPDTPTD